MQFCPADCVLPSERRLSSASLRFQPVSNVNGIEEVQMNTKWINTNSTDAGFTVWGVNRAAYGPVELPTLVAWIKDERVTADTWVFAGQTGMWSRAADIPELQLFFRSKSHAGGGGCAP